MGFVPVGVSVSEKRGDERRGDWVLTWVPRQSRQSQFFFSYTDKKKEKKKKVFLSYKLKVRGKREKSLKTKLNI